MTRNRSAALCAIFILCICAWSVAQSRAGEDRTRGGNAIGPVGDQVPQPVSRLLEPVDITRVVKLRGNTPPMARPQFDRGAVDSQMPLERMILVLKRSPEQEAALEAFMERQLDSGSPDFHHWLEPEEFGGLYGPSDSDIAVVKNWLLNSGFRVDDVTKGRTFLHFSGTAGQVAKAFHTEIHHYDVNGEKHIANNTDPSIPEALAPVVAGVFALHDFFARPQHIDLGSFRRDSKTRKWIPLNEDLIARPMLGVGTDTGTFELVSPHDFAAIYNVVGLWNAGIDGTGQTIAIAGRSTISAGDVSTFRSAFGLPAKPFVLVNNGPAPTSSDYTAEDVVENSLDVEWSGAVARNATIKFVTTRSTATTDGAVESAIYIIDKKNVAPIMSFSYGACELLYGTAGNSALDSMWQQGAAEGISEFVASGDQGAAACDVFPPDTNPPYPYEASYGLQVSGTSSTPYDVAVGGTDLAWANSTVSYWSSTNAADGQSALGYIPEVPWNGTCASLDVDTLIGTAAAGLDQEATCNFITADLTFYDALVNVVGGTGGASSCTTNNFTGTLPLDPGSCSEGYAKPSWQTGTGVPNDKKRDLPDVSLFASNGALQTAYVICDSASGPCTYSNANDALMQGVGGTSVASPAMAGIMALVEQTAGGGAQGLPNKEFYILAAKDNLTACNSSTVVKGNKCIFYDVTSDNNEVPCVTGTLDCHTETQGDTIGILTGYSAGRGYDLTTGLGSVNAYNLAQAWPKSGSAAGITLTPTTVSFPDTAMGTTSVAETVTVKNTGSSTVTLHSVSISGTNATSFVELNTCGTSLAAGAGCTVFVALKPAATGALKGSLSVSDTAGGSPQTATLSGTGTALDSVALSAKSLEFGSVAKGTTSAAKTVTVTNKGAAALNLTGTKITGAGAADFAELNTCGPTLAAGASCSIEVAFKPAGTASYAAVLSIADSGSASPQAVALTGTGIQ